VKQKKPLLIAAAAALVTSPAAAQLTAVPHSGEQSIVVTGERAKGAKPPEMSDWRVAETPHLLVFSKASPAELGRIALNLEKLHFLLSVLLNRVGTADQTLKLSVTLIGDHADFDHLQLKNIRWQQGPYPPEFPNQIYYDPREDGAVMATAQADQCFALVRDAVVLTPEDLESNIIGHSLPQSGVSVASSNSKCSSNPNMVAVSAESRLYSAFAQHFLLTYFPAAYPRWYLEGFGEIFANMDARTAGVIEYGREPDRYPAIMDKFGHYPVRKILDGTYLNDSHWTPAFSPYSAWALAHLLFFSPQWKVPLHNYLAAVARGESPQQAATAFGDIKKLQAALSSYRGTRVSFERLTYPLSHFQPPLVRRLKKSEASCVRGRLELGARVTVADSAGPAARKEIETRNQWLGALRQTATTYPAELADQQLLAEAECRSGNGSNCVAAADRALRLSPSDPASLSWKGFGLALEAQALPRENRGTLLSEARSTIGRANHLDTESVLPLLAYYRSYAIVGEQAPAVAVDGLAKALDEVPSAPATRLMLGSELTHEADPLDARRILLPIADGAFDPPEKPAAQQLLSGLSIKAGSDSSEAR